MNFTDQQKSEILRIVHLFRRHVRSQYEEVRASHQKQINDMLRGAAEKELVLTEQMLMLQSVWGKYPHLKPMGEKQAHLLKLDCQNMVRYARRLSDVIISWEDVGELLSKENFPPPKRFLDEIASLRGEGFLISQNVNKRYLAFQTEPITLLDRYYLGPYEIQLHTRDERSTPISEFRVVIRHLDPRRRPLECSSDICHPHVSLGTLCAGDMTTSLGNACKQLRIYDIVMLVNRILNNYNSGSTYAKLEEWPRGPIPIGVVPCEVCDGEIGEADHIIACKSCYHKMCKNCTISCERCNLRTCKKCVYRCGNASCSMSYCPNCKSDHVDSSPVIRQWSQERLDLLGEGVEPTEQQQVLFCSYCHSVERSAYRDLFRAQNRQRERAEERARLRGMLSPSDNTPPLVGVTSDASSTSASTEWISYG